MRTAVLLAAITASALSAGAAWACSCIRYDSAADQFARADAMFVGRVTATTALGAQQGETRFEVVRVLKGRLRNEAVVRHTIDDGGAACGVDFAVGETAVVIAHENDGALATNLCSMPQFPLQDYEALGGERG